MAALLSPNAKQQFFTDAGLLAAGHRLYTYAANTTTPQATYSNRAGSVANANPIILDARGEATIYLTSGVVYDYVLKTDQDALVWTREDVIADAGDANAVAFIQAGTGAITRTSQDKLRESVSVKDFGAVGDNTADDTVAIQAAVNHCVSSGVAGLYFPSGIYKISSQILITAPVFLHGDGLKKTIIRQSNATANGINFSYPSLAPGGGVRDLAIEAGAGWQTGGFQGLGSTGTGLTIQKVLGSFQFKDAAIHNFTNGLLHNLSWGTWVENVDILYFNGRGVQIDGTTAGGGNGDNRWLRVTCHNNGYTGDASSSIGFLILNTGHEQFMMCDAVKTSTGWMFRPDVAGKQVSYCFLDQCLSDSAFTNGFDFDGGIGGVVSVQCHNCWAAGSISNGVVTRTNVFEIHWVGGRLRENGASGWAMQGGSDVQITSAMINSNSQFNANIFPGVLVSAGVTKFAIMNCRIGNAASAISTQAHGIEIQAGASDLFRIIGNDLSNAGAGKLGLSNASTGTTNYVISDNIPVQANYNEFRGATIPVCTNGTVAVGTTTYIGPNGQFTNELDSLMVPGRGGSIARVFVNADSAPGVGQTFTYTLRKSGADTALTGAMTGATAAALLSGGPISINANDNFTIKLVTSAGAAVSRHRVTILIDP